MPTDDAWRSLQLISEWIKFADAKAAAILAANGVLTGFLLVTSIGSTPTRAAPTGLTTAALALACTLSSTVCALRVLTPTLRVGAPPSLIYFGSIARRFPNEQEPFVRRFLELTNDPEAFARDIADQVWANSVIADRKFRWVARSTWLTAAAFGLGTVATFTTRLSW